MSHDRGVVAMTAIADEIGAVNVCLGLLADKLQLRLVAREMAAFREIEGAVGGSRVDFGKCNCRLPRRLAEPVDSQMVERRRRRAGTR